MISSLALDKKAENVLLIDVRKITTMTDFFIICSADTDIQVKAIADSIRRGTPHKPTHTEGYQQVRWILLDYITVVVHVMRTRDRYYYNIEKLWADAPTEEFTDESPDHPE
ncbi:MAG: ribosome silencing factor [FCB group bacterium]|nr:ribosome silencing factor [FCB group bacterium]